MTDLATAIALTAMGPVAGSFASTVAIRATQSEQAISGRSRCDGCGHAVPFYLSLPLISFPMLGGRCIHCRTAIDPLHPIAEFLGLTVVATAFVAPGIRSMQMAVLGLSLLAAAVIDLKTFRLPNWLTLSVAVMAASLAFTHSPSQLASGLIAATLCAVVLLAVRWVSARRMGEPGLGLGDVKLSAALAIWLGPHIAEAMAVAAAAGLIVQLLRRRHGQLPFGPAIAGGAWVVGVALEAGLWS